MKKIESKQKPLEALTEGFAVYLTKLGRPESSGHIVEYFFADLLISIYGEDILEYPLCNDPIGLMLDDRFYDFTNFSIGLDYYSLCIKVLKIASSVKSDLERLMEENMEVGKEIIESIGKNIELLKKSIIRTFSAIIDEYLAYDKRLIEKELFIKKLSTFLTSVDYQFIFGFDKDNIVRRTLQAKIDLIR